MLLPQFPWTPDIIHPQSNLSLAPYPALLFFTRLPPPHEIKHSSTSLMPWYPLGKTLLELCTDDLYTALLNKHLMIDYRCWRWPCSPLEGRPWNHCQMSNSVYSSDMSHHKGVTCMSLGSERAQFGALSFKALPKKRREGAPAERRHGRGVAGELSGHHHRGREIQAWISPRANLGEFPGGPVIRTPHFPCRGHRFNPWSGN